METRKLGRTGLEVGVIGLGTEYLFHAPRETVLEVVHEALDGGVSYFDLLGPRPEYRDNLGAAFRDVFRTDRERVAVAGHLGVAVGEHGRWLTVRDADKSLEFFHDLLRRLGTDHVDVVNVTVVDERRDYEAVMAPGGLWEVADRLRREGKARFIGLSGHRLETTVAAVTSGRFDTAMYPVNLAARPEEAERVGRACAEAGVGLIAMKPFYGGEFFQPPYSAFVTPALALSYVLSRPGVSTTVPGAGNPAQMRSTLAFFDASREERDFAPVMANFEERVRGTCLYCGRCLPCPAAISIADVIWALRAARRGSDYGPRSYAGLEVKASACNGCAECLDRCPFEVDIIGQLKEAARVFASPAARTPGGCRGFSGRR